MLAAQKIKRCFIIGPMGDTRRLQGIRDRIVRPILEPIGFKVLTPDEGEIGNIMRQVLLNLEQSDILVADISGANPNVMYELGVYHCFGKPYIAFKDQDFPQGAGSTPFDIAEYRYCDIRCSDPAGAVEVLRPRLLDLVDKIDKRDWFGNPVTDFFQSPVAEIPTAIGLFKNYRKNFLDQILPKVFQREEFRPNYSIEVRLDDGTRNTDGKPALPDASDIDRANLSFEILLPRSMNLANHSSIDQLKEMGRFPFRTAEVGRRTRPFRLHHHRTPEGRLVLCDVPTVLSTLNESIQQRRKIHRDQFGGEEWEILEKQELERFGSKCEQFVAEMARENPITEKRIVIRWDWSPG